jgi:hypothetical protein
MRVIDKRIDVCYDNTLASSQRQRFVLSDQRKRRLVPVPVGPHCRVDRKNSAFSSVGSNDQIGFDPFDAGDRASWRQLLHLKQVNVIVQRVQHFAAVSFSDLFDIGAVRDFNNDEVVASPRLQSE